MTRRKADIHVAAEFGLTAEQLARAFNLGMEKFAEIRPRLEASGFPRPHPVFGRYLVAEVAAWCAREAARRAAPDCAPGAEAPKVPAEGTGGAVVRLISERIKDGNI